MDKRNFTPLFAVVMILMLIPFLPAYIEQELQDHNTRQAIEELTSIPTVSASVVNAQSTQDYLAAGYVGSFGLAAVPEPPPSPPARVLGVSTTRRVTPLTYTAREVGKSNAVLNLSPGQQVTVWVDFLNTGTATWYRSGANPIAVVLSSPTNRTSAFWHPFWSTARQPARLLEREVKPGSTGRFRFALRAPTTTGTYREKFQLTRGTANAIDGGYFELLIGVGDKVIRPPDYRAEEVERSNGGTLSLQPGQSITFWIDFKNTGLKNWYRTGDRFIALNVTDPVGRVSSFKHDFWTEYYYRPTRLAQAHIYPGENGRFRFALQAPLVAGYYTENFALVAENYTWIPGSEFSIDFKVGNPSETAAPSPLIRSANEPTVRIGMFSATQPITITANGAYTVSNMTDGTSSTNNSGESTTVPNSTNTYYRIVPISTDTILTISSWENKPSWNSTLNDNTFRGNLEIRYAASTKSVWVINELPVESYLRGLAEVTNGQPPEYLKALITSARTYILWHMLRGGKHPNEHFDINATTDQVYRGYGFEQRSVDPLAAVIATAGTVVTHPDSISSLNPLGLAITPYSSGTDGRTRSWQEVWDTGGFPWCLSVDDPYGKISNYNTLSGNHMVGLSAAGARGYALKENKTYDWILQHYYTGVTITKIF